MGLHPGDSKIHQWALFHQADGRRANLSTEDAAFLLEGCPDNWKVFRFKVQLIVLDPASLPLNQHGSPFADGPAARPVRAMFSQMQGGIVLMADAEQQYKSVQCIQLA